MSVFVREFRHTDIQVIASLINRTWVEPYKSHSDFFTQRFGFAYLYYHISQSSFVRVAECNGKTAGIVCMEEYGCKKVFAHFRIRSVINFILFLLLPENIKYIQGWKKFHRITQAQEKSLTRSYDAELRLLMTLEDCRGAGAGKTLLKAAEEKLKDAGKNSYFLNTDTECNYKFYDSMGMKRIRSTTVTDEEGKNTDWEIYLYSKE